MTDLQTIGSDELAAVNGGEFNWQSIGQSVLGGLFNGAAQGVQSGQGFDGIFKSVFSGGLSAFTKSFTGQLNGGGQSQ
jgi:hypothetical protein